MLKITTRTDPTGTSFELEGKLVGLWVQELKVCWQKVMRSESSIRVLLCGVTFIDEKGKDLLVEMYRDGAKLVAEGCMNKAIIDEILQGKRS